MRKTIIIIIAVILAILLVGCSSRNDVDGPYSKDMGAGEASEGNNQDYEIQAGQLTAGEWSDKDNYDYFLSLFSLTSQDENDTYLIEALNSYKSMGLLFNRFIAVKVFDEYNKPISNARISLINGNTPKAVTYTDAMGSTYINTNEMELSQVKVSYGDIEDIKEVNLNEDNAFIQLTFNLETIAQKPVNKQLMFIIDTTGSMGDELEYLKAEVKDVISRVNKPGAANEIEVALLFYRDHGDEYITRFFDFETDINNILNKLKMQSSSGGGDFPEAVDEALNEGINAHGWKKDAEKLIIHLADAPIHTESQEKLQNFKKAINNARNNGIRIVPIACSGVDKLTEFMMRYEALYTGGTYIFLTNDSGIGNEKITPTTGEYVVEYLNNCLVRVIAYYLNGEIIKKIPYYEQ